MELKPCPFCGGQPVKQKWEMAVYERLHIPDNHGYWYSIFCDNCLSEGRECVTEEEAIKAWNRRV